MIMSSIYIVDESDLLAIAMIIGHMLDSIMASPISY